MVQTLRGEQQGSPPTPKLTPMRAHTTPSSFLPAALPAAITGSRRAGRGAGWSLIKKHRFVGQAQRLGPWRELCAAALWGLAVGRERLGQMAETGS